MDLPDDLHTMVVNLARDSNRSISSTIAAIVERQLAATARPRLVDDEATGLRVLDFGHPITTEGVHSLEDVRQWLGEGWPVDTTSGLPHWTADCPTGFAGDVAWAEAQAGRLPDSRNEPCAATRVVPITIGTYASLESTRSWCAHHGTHAAPDVCWLALRGLRTLAVRLARHQDSALEIAAWLQTRPQVAKVMFPALVDDPGHDLWRKQFGGAPGPFTIELQTCDESSFAAFIDGLQVFGLGTSWGGFESLVMPVIPHHLRSKPVLPDDGRLVRLHIGLEHPDDLQSDLAQALGNLAPAPT